MADGPQSNRDILRAWFDDVWVAGNTDAIPRYLASTSQHAGLLPDSALDTNEVADLAQAMLEGLGPIRIDLVKTVEAGDWISALIDVRTSREDNGDPVHVTGQIMVRFEDGKMAEAYHAFDFMLFFEQLGRLPSNALALLLTGSRLG